MMSETFLIDENRELLKLETQNLSQLKLSSQQCCANTVAIRSLLTEFDDRLAKLERDIQPVYKETGNLQSKQAELAKTLERLDHVIQFYSVTGDVNDIINAGPANQLEIYIDSLRRLKRAIHYFSQNNPDSPEHMNVTSLYKDGCDAVEKEFKLTLQRYSLPVAPITLQDIVDDSVSDHQLDSGNSCDTSAASTNGSFRRHQADLPSDKIDDLRIMCEWLCESCNEELINIYADIRSDYICKSLRSLQDFKRSQSVPHSMVSTSSAGSNNSNPGTSSRGSIDSPDMTLTKKRINAAPRDLTHRKTSKSIQAFKRKLHNVIPGDVSYRLSSSSLDEITISEREVAIYLTCITAFHKLAVIELNLISEIVPADLKKIIYNRLIQEALKYVANEANNLTLRVKRAIAKHDFTSALNLFPILHYPTNQSNSLDSFDRRNNFDFLFDGCQSEALSRFQGLTVTFQATISKSLEEFAGFVQSYNDIKVPGDGTVHELTNNVMIFIKQLHPHLDIMSSVIPIKDMQAMENCNDKNRLGFAQYITRLLSSLSETIQRKAESYTNPQLGFLFKINNYHYILKRLREYGLLEIVHTYIPQVQSIYETLIDENKNGYLKGLLPVINNLVGQDNRTKSIKERFSGFNKEFQELYRLNRTYAVPDVELRTQMREMCKQELLSCYGRFFDHYANQDFSKSKEKYIKYTPELVSSMIDQFFESN